MDAPQTVKRAVAACLVALLAASAALAAALLLARPSADALMAATAARAVRAARQDYSVALACDSRSVEQVERILGRLHEEHRRQPFSEERLDLEARQWGAYVGEAIKRERPARWARDSAKMGKGALPLVCGERELYPCAWCYQRIVNGPEHNVWRKYQLCLSARPGGPDAGRAAPEAPPAAAGNSPAGRAAPK